MPSFPVGKASPEKIFFVKTKKTVDKEVVLRVDNKLSGCGKNFV
jgi:hypothetical protein